MPAQLCSLRIRNLALVEDLSWSLQPGFTVVTGETGSGKSMILGALKLLIGERADKSLIRSVADSCTVEACFEIPEPASLNSLLLEQGVESCEDGQLLLKRILTATGTNRQFINGSPTTLAVLKQLGDLLVDLHGPHDHQSLLSTDLQRALLDASANASAAHSAYSELFLRTRQLRRELEALCGDETVFERERALLAHQCAEIEAADLKPGEEAELLSRYQLASQGRKLSELLRSLQTRLDEGEDSALERVTDLARPLKELERIDPSAKPLAETHSRAVSELEDLSRQLQHYADHIDLDPESLLKLEDRVNLLESLKRKYGASIEEVIAFGLHAAERHRKLSSRDEERTRIQKLIDQTRRDLDCKAATLGELRRKAAPTLSEKVTRNMRDLGLARASFQIEIRPLAEPSPHGMEEVEFLFAPNPGEPPKPLRAIASSGEISRVMLALKSALADEDAVALLVFDEIDANVGGEIAHSVGLKMASLGRSKQVLCISHLPQVASKADHHFVVSKQYVGDRTISDLTPVEGVQREEEVARMLGGKTESALALARALLSR